MSRFSRVVALAAALLTLFVTVPAGAQQAVSAGAATGRVQGVVWDSTRNAPLAGSVVQLVRADGQSAPRSTRSDDKGRFEVDSVAPGQWILAILHPRLDTLALEEYAQRVEVKRRGTTRASVALPSGSTLSQQLCRADPRDSTGYMTGQIRRAEGNREPISGTVRAEWMELTVVDGRLDRRIAAVQAQASDSGSYLLCGVPMNTTTRMWAWRGEDSTGVIELEMTTSGIARQDFHVGRTRYVRQLLDSTAAADDTLNTVVWRRGAGSLRGVVTNIDGQPVANAMITLPGSGHSLRTNAAGRFELMDVATGTQLLDVRAIGFEPLRMPVVISETDTQVMALSLSKVVKLAAVDVRAARAKLMGQEMIDFERRRRTSATGRFFGPEDMIALDPLRISSLLERIPGVRVVQNGMFGDVILMRGVSFSQFCAPDIWLDGFRISNDGSMDFFVPPTQLRAVEVYTRTTGAAAQWTTTSGCGVILLWSGPREVPGREGR